VVVLAGFGERSIRRERCLHIGAMRFLGWRVAPDIPSPTQNKSSGSTSNSTTEKLTAKILTSATIYTSGTASGTSIGDTSEFSMNVRVVP
jgi:hypothetical protein